MSEFAVSEMKESEVEPIATQSDALTLADVRAMLDKLDTKPEQWFEVKRYENPGNSNRAHRIRARVLRVLEEAEVSGYEFTVREGCVLHGRKVA